MDLGEPLEINAMREVGVGPMLGNLRIISGGTTETLVTVDQGQVLEQVPLEIELDVLNVEGTITS